MALLLWLFTTCLVAFRYKGEDELRPCLKQKRQNEIMLVPVLNAPMELYNFIFLVYSKERKMSTPTTIVPELQLVESREHRHSVPTYWLCSKEELPIRSKNTTTPMGLVPRTMLSFFPGPKSPSCPLLLFNSILIIECLCFRYHDGCWRNTDKTHSPLPKRTHPL